MQTNSGLSKHSSTQSNKANKSFRPCEHTRPPVRPPAGSIFDKSDKDG